MYFKIFTSGRANSNASKFVRSSCSAIHMHNCCVIFRFMAREHCSVGSAGWMPARIGRLSPGIGRRLAICKASLMVRSMKRVWALWHQTGAQYSAVQWTRARVAVRNVVVPAPQPEPASRLRSARRDVSFLWSDSWCRRYVSDLSNVILRYLGLEQKGRVSLLKLTFSSSLASLLRWKTPSTVFVVLSFIFQV